MRPFPGFQPRPATGYLDFPELTPRRAEINSGFVERLPLLLDLKVQMSFLDLHYRAHPRHFQDRNISFDSPKSRRSPQSGRASLTLVRSRIGAASRLRFGCGMER
jgi:hypothetical protein